MDDSVLRQEVIQLLRGEQAHCGVHQVFAGVEPENRHRKTDDANPSVWEILEHVRIAQEDILRYMTDADWKSPEWPGGYWPSDDRTPTDAEWEQSVARFLEGIETAASLCADERVAILGPVPHAAEHTYLRELLLIADHNAYHLGQAVQTRKILGDWAT